MEAETVKYGEDQILAVLEERGSVVVPRGKRFTKNLWNEFGLRHINRNDLQGIVGELVKTGVVSCVEEDAAPADDDEAGVVRYHATLPVRVYALVKP